MSHSEKAISKKTPSPPLKKEQENAQLSHVAFNAATEGMIVSGPEQNILSVNSAFTEITGYTAEEVIGKSPSILQSGQHGSAFSAILQNANRPKEKSISGRLTMRSRVWLTACFFQNVLNRR